MAPRRGVTEFLEVFESDKSIFFDIETDFLITMDEGGSILRVNPAFERTLGYTELEVIGKSLIFFITIDDSNKSEPRIMFLKKGGGSVACKSANWKNKNRKHYAIFRRVS